MIEYTARGSRFLWQFLNKNLRRLAAALRLPILGYDVYTALITQDGVGNPPEVKVLRNTLNIDISWTYVGLGTYYGIINTSLFDSENEYVTITSSSSSGGDTYSAQVVPIFFNVIKVTSYTNNVVKDDVIGYNVPYVLEIRKYR